jgi:hypothetical protein
LPFRNLPIHDFPHFSLLKAPFFGKIWNFWVSLGRANANERLMMLLYLPQPLLNMVEARLGRPNSWSM